MNYTLHQLKIFAAIVKYKNLRQVAQLLFLTPPAITKQLQNLEEILEIDLFERKNKKLVITSKGESFYSLISPVLERIDEINHVGLPDLRSSPPKIKIAMSQIFEQSVFNRINTFMNKKPLFAYDLIVDHKQSVLEKILNYDVDVAIMVLNQEELIAIEKQGFYADLYYHIEFDAYASSGLLNKYRNVNEMISKARFITEAKSVGNRNIKNMMPLSSCMSVLNAINQGLGYGFLPTVLLREEDRDSLVKINDKLHYQEGALHSYYVYKFSDTKKSNLIRELFE
ncbi:LysR family transcriptional regulator [Francisella adeliensis]|uniref:LysR family transcriptional regulator n=1 Tax=Francisella adeliensis TaxID=2007306 RepID=A0A2Z4Y0C1_9GAMM|nr:LysR family transcriptional regulator [Francisella adeliensis]AXA34601.1 hypothetical protein CDH04_09425 [Francisella adeliensis]MBK2086326.1 LysR family transcriptional regulator [Francisella adeliensis]MBK2096541.1 LysR family transcriptional regulator [Francisella adeliensis]QIW12845.1 LysR family transcriptional regulator [Francisella adeliensis]QIW14722.1 LysR family transcriptional regulator [Francisella adeliensis]